MLKNSLIIVIISLLASHLRLAFYLALRINQRFPSAIIVATKMNRELWLIAVLSLTVIAIALLLPAVSQPSDYHDFADQRSFWGIPNFNDVISNIAFVFSGGAGLALLFRFYTNATQQAFHHIRECISYALLFLSVIAAGFGSTYYHWSPDNDRLMWDRLPIAVGIVSLLSATSTDRISARLIPWILLPLIVLAVTSVLYWYWTELQGAGNLNLYIAVQFYSIALIAWIGSRFPSRYTHGTYIRPLHNLENFAVATEKNSQIALVACHSGRK